MLRILLRADDLGYSVGVNCGIAWACDNGLPMSIGLMMGMPDVRQGYELIAGKSHCLGVHTTISAGRPLSDPADVPSLVDENGVFHSSAFYHAAKEDPAVLAEVEREAEAQYQAFIELTGREPDYVDVHAVSSKNFVMGAYNVACRHGKPFSYLPHGESMHVGSSDVLLHGFQGDLGRLLDEVVAAEAQATEPVVHILMLHPGFVDAQLMRTSSLNTQRMTDAEVLRGEELRAFVTRDDVELLTYRDL